MALNDYSTSHVTQSLHTMCTKDTRPATQQPRTVLGRFVREVRLVAAGAAIIGSRAVGVGVRPRWRYGNDEMLSSRLVDPPTSTAPSQNGHTIYTTHCYNNVLYIQIRGQRQQRRQHSVFYLTGLFFQRSLQVRPGPSKVFQRWIFTRTTHSIAWSVLRQHVCLSVTCWYCV